MATKVINSLTLGDTYVFTTPYATSSTGAGTQAKVATMTPNSNFNLETGVRIAVKFSSANSVASPTLNVNNSGAKTIQFRGAALTSSLYYWAANSVVEFMYDGTYWQMLGAPNNTNSTYTVNNGTITLSAGTGLSGGGDFTTNQASAETITFSLATSGVTASSYGPSANATLSHSGTFSVPYVTVDAYGRLTSASTITYTLPGSGNTDYRASSCNTSSKIYLIGATSQGSATTTSMTTYSHDTAYVGTDGCLYSGGKKVLTDHLSVTNNGPTLAWSTTSTIGTVGGTALTVTMPANPNTNSAHSHTAGTGLTISGSGGTSGTTTYSANLNSTTSLGTIGTTSKLYAVGVDANGKLCVKVPWTDTDTNTHYTTKLFATSSSGTAHAATTNGNTYLRLFDDSTARQSINLTGSGATTVTSDANGVITFNSTDTLPYVLNETDSSERWFITGIRGGVDYMARASGGNHLYMQGNTMHLHGSLMLGNEDEEDYSDDYKILPAYSNYSTIGDDAHAFYQVWSNNYYKGGLELDDIYAPLEHSHGDTDTKVTQAAAITATTSANYPVMLGYSTATTAVTNTLKKSAKLLFNTGTGALTIGSGNFAGSGSLTVDGDIIAGGGNDSYGIRPKTNNYSTLGTASYKWYKVYATSFYGSYYNADGTSFTPTLAWNTF